MARKSEISSNPVRQIRLKQHKTLDEFANECGIHIQALFRCEHGMYPSVLPSICQRLNHQYGIDLAELTTSYEDFIRSKRYTFGKARYPYTLPEPDRKISPLTQFRNYLGFKSAFGMGKAICLGPTTILRAERGDTPRLPGQVEFALRGILLPVEDIQEMSFRQEEFVHGYQRI